MNTLNLVGLNDSSTQTQVKYKETIGILISISQINSFFKRWTFAIYQENKSWRAQVNLT